MKALILGYAGTGRELASWLLQEGYAEIQFLDDFKTNPDVVGVIQDWERYGSCDIFSAIGSYSTMAVRKKIHALIPLSRFSSCFSSASTVLSNNIGSGTVVFPNSIVSIDAHVGDLNLIYHNCVVSHDVRIGCNSIISNGVVLSGSVQIGNDSYIGAGSVVIEGKSIGNGCIVAAGSTVVCDVPDNTIYIAPKKMTLNKYWKL